MSEELLVRHCSPTLAGIKTGNLFACSFENDRDLRENMRKLNKTFVKKGLRILPMRFHDSKALLYVYRPSRLSKDLQNDTARRLLEQRGYNPNEPGLCVVRLIQRLSESDDFPHEIGCFLGYPPEDVCGFIENGAKDCKYVGCWKVYGDVDAAKKTFAKYKKCTDVYCALFEKGKSVERLTVAV